MMNPRPPRTPRWVKVFGAALGLLVLAVAVMLAHGLIAGRGPFQHMH